MQVPMTRVLLLFVDGVGLGTDSADVNPFRVARLPNVERLLGGGAATASAAPYHGSAASLVGIDAVLGVAGTPQSGTGQASLLTGVNAAAIHGRHFGPWVPSGLRTLVRDQSILARARAAGRTAVFANAYPEEVKQLDADGAGAAADDRTGATDANGAGATGADGTGATGADGTGATAPNRLPADAPGNRGRSRRGSAFLRAGPPLAALGAGLLTRHTPELERGDAVASELTNEGWREKLGRRSVPAIDAVTAGRNLARIAGAADVTLFAHYTTDYAGHQQDMAAAVAALEKLDTFMGGLVEAAASDLLIAVVSDHGNIEDIRVGHTRNPALGLIIGKDHEQVARRLHSLTDVTPALMDYADLSTDSTSAP
jgi:2,3-bisphosphoglycerate-independent phosphoglycerate mutase